MRPAHAGKRKIRSTWERGAVKTHPMTLAEEGSICRAPPREPQTRGGCETVLNFVCRMSLRTPEGDSSRGAQVGAQGAEQGQVGNSRCDGNLLLSSRLSFLRVLRDVFHPHQPQRILSISSTLSRPQPLPSHCQGHYHHEKRKQLSWGLHFNCSSRRENQQKC